MNRNRWKKSVLAGLAVLTALSGCKQQLFMEPGDYHDAVKYGVPKELEYNPHGSIVPPAVPPIGDGPATVLDPTRPARYITLKEAIALALEQGNIGSQQQNQFGFKLETANTFSGRAVTGTDAVRAFALDPAVAGADIERSLSKFDARWITSMTWQKVDQPVAAQFLSFQQQRDAANFTTTLAKPLPTGGVAGITFSTDYSKFTNVTQAGFVNPNYTPRLQFTFEQPLLQLFGVEINQIANVNPTSQLIQGLRPSGGTTTEGILLTRIRFDQSRAEFERNINFMLINVEAAYWNLYASYYNLYAQEQGLLQSYNGYRFQAARVAAGTDPPQRENQARAQFELFRAQVYRARGQVLESERQLRGLTGLRSDDGVRLVPIDEPNLAPYKPDYYEAANEAMANRPELTLARQELKAQQLNLMLQKNLRRPDLRWFSSYDVAGLGTRLDGPEFTGPNGNTLGNAMTSFGNNQFNSWTMGLRMDMPLGFRDANAAVRQARLQMTRTYYLLRDAELKTIEYLSSRYRRVVETHAVIRPLRARRQELSIYVEKIRRVIEIGRWQPEEFFNLLQVQRDLAQAISDEFAAIAQYNSALAELEFAKGTIMRYNNVSLGEGPLPPWVQKRAADHIRERTEAAIQVRERPADAAAVPAAANYPVGQAVGNPFAATLPPFAQPLQQIPTLPPPNPVADPNAAPMGQPMGELKTLPMGQPLPEVDPAPGMNPVPPKAAPGMGAGAAALPGSNHPDPDAIFAPVGSVSAQPRTPIRPLEAPTEVPAPAVPPVAAPPTSAIPPTLPPGAFSPVAAPTTPTP